jgi:cytochrome c peroxidase
MFATRVSLGLFCCFAFLLYNCRQSDVDSAHPAFWTQPVHFPEPFYTFGDNNRSALVYELGRKLFYDPILSLDSTISCASCHLQAHGFSDTVDYSFGIRGRKGKRNSPALANLAWNPHFMLDGGINHIEVMPIAPITDSVEMAIPLKNLILRLNQNIPYKKQFEAAFQVDSISDQQLLWSLAQFLAGLISAESPYDIYIKSEGKSPMSSKAMMGLHLFSKHCSSCHTPPLFTSYAFASNGTGDDQGRFIITRDSADLEKYRIPSLRNIALSAPYMHDGRYSTLEEVLNHYSDTLKTINKVDQRLVGGIPLSQSDKEAIISFLHQLTDDSYIHNPLFARPK